MQKVNIYLLSDIKSPGRKTAGTYIYIIEMADTAIKGTVKGVKTLTDVTGNQLELKALTDALGRFSKKCILNIYTDSHYIISAINNGWLDSWREKGWKTSRNGIVANKEEWETLCLALAGHEARFNEIDGEHRELLEKEIYRR